jgi:hypothetical protein
MAGRRPRPLAISSGDVQAADVSQYLARCEYLAILRKLRDDSTASRIRGAWDALDAIVDQPRTESREAALDAWGKTFHCGDAWLIEVAAETIAEWSADVESRADCDWSYPPSPDMWSGQPIVVAFAWDQQAEREVEFRTRVEAIVEEYIAERKRARAADGLVTPITKASLDHFEWVALHQVACMTYYEVAERVQDANGSPTEPAISQAINRAAKLLGITLRPVPRRPQRV